MPDSPATEYWYALRSRNIHSFIALILISHLDHKMKKANLYKMYTMQQLLDTLDVIECFDDKSHALRLGELLNKQVAIYEALDVAPPTSAC